MNNQLVASSEATARTSMLRIARAWQTSGQLHHAIDAYLRLCHRYPDSPEAHDAAAQILALAQSYEQQGQYRMAMDLYNRLERLS